MAAMVVDKNKSFFLCWKVNSSHANSAKNIHIVLGPYHVVANKPRLIPILGKLRNRQLFIDWNSKMRFHLVPLWVGKLEINHFTIFLEER